MKKRVLSILLVLHMMLSLLPMQALAADSGRIRTIPPTEEFSPDKTCEEREDPLKPASVPGRTITVENSGDLWQIIANAQDGDTIELSGSCVAIDPTSADAPLVINKAITIRGGSLTLRTGGIILAADVTFCDTTIGFSSFIRNTIMANGHTLTLENVSCDVFARPLNLFCGGLYDPGGFSSTPGEHGKIILRGTVNLGSEEGMGNLYAGNLCMGGLTETDSDIQGPANQFAGDASIVLAEGCGGALGQIYAGGAQQKIPAGAVSGKVILTDPAKYTVAGSVNISLWDGLIKSVDGTGAAEAYVEYNGGVYPTTNLTMTDLSGLTVESGYLIPAAGSDFREGTSLSVLKGAQLGLANYGTLTVNSFSGGGVLLLGQSQCLSVTGEAEGNTTIGIGYLTDNGGSTLPPIEDHCYIYAPKSGADAFRLAPPNFSPDMQFARDENGGWSVHSAGIPTLVESFCFEKYVTSVSAGDWPEIPWTAEYVDNGTSQMDLFYVPLTVIVNGQGAVCHKIGTAYYYIAENEGLRINVSDESVFVSHKDYAEDPDMEYIPVPEGTYTIELIIPPEHTSTGQSLWAKAILVVGNDNVPEPDCWIKSVSVGEERVTIDIGTLAENAALPNSVVCAAVYAEDGRMLALAKEPLPDSGTVTMPLDLSGAGVMKVFLSDGSDIRPLCQSQSIPTEWMLS